jgi:hypothetical protein
MNDLGLEVNVAASTLQQASLSGLIGNFAAASGTLFGGLDDLCLLAEKFGNHLSSNLINAENRLVLNCLEIG